MNQIITMLLGQLKADKGRDINRTTVLVGVLYLCWQVTVLDKRVAVIEAAHAPRPAHYGATQTNGAGVGPDWPRQTAAAFQ